MAILDAVARRYGCRPSSLVGERDPARALSIDLNALKWGRFEDWKAAKKGVPPRG
jgi:hypothetical protein